MRTLFVSRWFPYPPVNGSKQRVYQLVRALAERHRVVLLSFADHPSIEPEAAEIRALCDEIIVVPWHAYRPRSARALLALTSATPRFLVDTHSAEMAQRIHNVCARRACDVVVASQLSSASYHRRFRGVPAVLDEIELGVFYDRFQQAPRGVSRVRHGLTWLKLRHYLADVLRDVQACTVVSAPERTLLRRAVPTAPPVEIIANGSSVASSDTVWPPPQPETLVFAGALSYAANADGIRWFLDAVYPIIRQQRPRVRLTVTGDSGGQRLDADGVVQSGHLPDVRSVVAGAMVSIAPLLWGGGTRMKILEALALGTPVVATTKAAEGLDLIDGQHVLIADNGPVFAQHVLRLLGDAELRRRLTDNARRFVAERYDWRTIGRRFVDLVESVAHAERRQ